MWRQEDIKKALVFVPTTNAAKALTNALMLTSTAPTQELPRVLPLSPSAAGFAVAPEKPLISELEKRLFFYTQISAKAHVQGVKLPPEQAWNLASSLENIVSEFTVNFLDAGAVKEVLAAHHLAQHWEDNLALLSIALESYPAFLKEQNLTDPAAHDVATFSSWSKVLKDFDDPIYGVGFPDTTALGMTVLKEIAQRENGVILSPALAGHQASDAPLRALWEGLNLPEPVPLMTENGQKETKKDKRAPMLVEAADDLSATLSIALQMKECYAKNKTVMLVTPDGHFGRRVQQHLSEWGLLADDSAGMALSASDAGQFFLMLLAVAAELSPALLAGLIQHPLCTLDGAEDMDALMLRGQAPKHQNLKRWARRASQLPYNFPKPEETSLQAAQSAWAAIENILTPLMSQPVHVQGITSYMGHAITAFEGFTDQPLPEDMKDALLNLARALEETSFPINRSSMTGLCRAHLSGIMTRPQGDMSLKIRGPLQARFEEADTLILAPLDAGAWPAEVGHHPWLNHQLRHELGLPDTAKVQQLAANHFYALMGRANADTRLLRTRHTLTGEEQAPSPLWEDTLRIYSKSELQDMRARGNMYLLYGDALIAEGMMLDFYTPDATLVDVRPDGETWSASFVEALMACPYAARLSRFHRLAADEDYAAPIDARDKGNMIHDVLYAFYQNPMHPPKNCPPPFEGPVTFARLDEATHHVLAILDAYLADFDTHIKHIWRLRLTPQLTAWTTEMAEMTQKGRRPALLEYAGSTPLTDRITLKVKADRIDVLSTGGCVIVDYKTGTPPSAKAVLSGVKPQLLIEAYLAKSGAFGEAYTKPIAVEYWNIGTHARNFEITRIDLTPEILEETAAGLKQLAERHQEGMFTASTSQGRGHFAKDELTGVVRHKNLKAAS